MKLIYEASNSIEGHMIINLLEQAGLRARLDGEYLQGGAGELQALGVIRVMVAEQDYEAAKSIIAEWDAQQPTAEADTPKKRGAFGASALGFVGGFVGGAALMVVYYSTPVTYDGIDHNEDGILDEKWKYVNSSISTSEIDRNFDGKTDFIYTFDRKGIVKSSSLDEDFNDSFETTIYYEYGNPTLLTSDTEGDGFENYRITYKHGVADTATFINKKTKAIKKIQEFGPINLERSEVDSDDDGVLDTVYEYDSIEEIEHQYKK